MKFEKLNYGKEKNKRMFLYGFIVCAIFLVLLNIIISKALYSKTESVQLATGTVNYSLADFNIVAAYLENDEAGTYTKSDTIPQKGEGYTFNSERSTCTNDVTMKWDYINWGLLSTNITKTGVKCTLYFDKGNAVDIILANNTVQNTEPDFSKTSCKGECDEGNSGLYKAEDDYGETYYFRGTIDNNWVSFAGFYWRIIRINGNGTIRMIYNGTTPTQTGEETTIKVRTAYNYGSNNNMYVGYMYSSGQNHGVENSSKIKNEIDSWYEKNILSDEKSVEKIDTDTGFCNDRVSYICTSYGNDCPNKGGGTGTTTDFYAPWVRVYINKKPSFKCEFQQDNFTIKGATNGNGALKYPIAMITADEVMFAGATFSKENKAFYLNNNYHFWTMSPIGYTNQIAGGGYSSYFSAVFYLYPNGFLTFSGTDSTGIPGVRPVINLKSNVKFKAEEEGTPGSSSNPYVVQLD